MTRSVGNLDRSGPGRVFTVFLFCALCLSTAPWISAGAAEPANTQWPAPRHDTRNTGLSGYEGIAHQPQRRWTIPGGGIILSSPVVGPGGTIYCGSQDHDFYAISRLGKIEWTFQTNDFIRGSAAVAMDGTIYFGSYDRNLYALTPKGELKWCFTTNGGIGSSPAIGADGTVYFGGIDTYLYAIGPNGMMKWRFKTGDRITVSTPAIGADGTIYVGSYDHNLYAVNPGGTLKWSFDTGCRIRCSPTIAGDGTVYIGCRSGLVFAVDEEGGFKWLFASGGEVRSSTALGPDGTVYFGSWDHFLYALNPDGTEKWRYLLEGPIEADPAVDASGVVYVTCQGGGYYAITPEGALRWTVDEAVYHGSPAIGGDGVIYGTNDFNFTAYGDPLPDINMILNDSEFETGDTVKGSIRIKNAAPVSYTVELKIWLEDPDGGIHELFKTESMELWPDFDQTQIVYFHRFQGDEREGRYTIGSSARIPETGDSYDEDEKSFIYRR